MRRVWQNGSAESVLFEAKREINHILVQSLLEFFLGPLLLTLFCQHLGSLCDIRSQQRANKSNLGSSV
jgi:hypothetical protein